MKKEEIVKAFEGKDKVSLKELYHLLGAEHITAKAAVRGIINANLKQFVRIEKGVYRLATIP